MIGVDDGLAGSEDPCKRAKPANKHWVQHICGWVMVRRCAGAGGDPSPTPGWVRNGWGFLLSG